MKLQRAPISNTCLLTAFAMVLGVNAQDLMCSDPHEVMWPQLEKPQRYRGHHIQEMIDILWDYGYNVTEIQALPRFGQLGCTETYLLFDNDMAMERIQRYMTGSVGVITSPTHAVAWDGKMIYDPKGTMYPIEEYTDTIQSFYLVELQS